MAKRSEIVGDVASLPAGSRRGAADLGRVLLTCTASGGTWRYGLELARGFAAAGVTSVLAVLGAPPSVEQTQEAASVPGLLLVATGMPSEAEAADEVELRETGAMLAGLARRLHADTVHLHTPAFAAEVPWPVPVVAVTQSDIGTWWQAVRGGTLPEALAWRAAAVGRGLAEANVAIAPTRSFARALSRCYMPGRPITVVPNGRSRMALRPCLRRRAVLAAGRLWDDAKNVRMIDRAAAHLDAPVLAAGPLEGPDGRSVTLTHLAPLGLLDEAALSARMAEASVFASAARYEPFGLAVLEAAQAGMALALSDIPTHRELWDGAALFFHPEDTGAMADVLTRLLARPEGAAARAQERAATYSAAAMVNATLALHRQLVGLSSGASAG